MVAPVMPALPVMPVVGLTADSRSALHASIPMGSAATPPCPSATAAAHNMAGGVTMGTVAAAQTPTVPSQLPLHVHQQWVSGGAAVVPVACPAPAVALSRIAAAATGTTRAPCHAPPPQTPTQADRSLRSVGFSPPGVGPNLQRQVSRLSTASQGSPKLSVTARDCSAPVEFGGITAPAHTWAGFDDELLTADCSCSSPLPGSPRANAPPLPWDSRGHAAEWAKASNSETPVWIPPSSPLRTAVPLGTRQMEADRSNPRLSDVHRDMPPAARVPMTKLHSQMSFGVCKQEEPYSPSSAHRRLRQLSCEAADPYAGIQLTPLNDRPFQTLASIARQAQESLLERLSPQGQAHLAERPSSS